MTNNMPRLSKDEQRQRIDSLAPKLARSGRFKSWFEIEIHLRLKEDLPEASELAEVIRQARHVPQPVMPRCSEGLPKEA